MHVSAGLEVVKEVIFSQFRSEKNKKTNKKNK